MFPSIAGFSLFHAISDRFLRYQQNDGIFVGTFKNLFATGIVAFAAIAYVREPPLFGRKGSTFRSVRRKHHRMSITGLMANRPRCQLQRDRCGHIARYVCTRNILFTQILKPSFRLTFGLENT